MQSSTISLLKADLERDEGRRSRPYKDSVGKLTVGVGHNLDADGLCEAAIDAQLEYDLETKVFNQLDRHLSWSRNAPESVQRGLANICFNLGIGGLLEFRATLRLLEAGHYKEAADQLLTNHKYHTQIGKRLDRIADLWRTAD